MWRLEYVSEEELQINAKARRGSAADSMFSTGSVGGRYQVGGGCAGTDISPCSEVKIMSLHFNRMQRKQGSSQKKIKGGWF